MELTQLFKRHQVTSDNITKFKESLEQLEKDYQFENDNTKLLNEVQQRAFKSTLETLNNELIELETQIKNYQISIEGSKLNLPLESDNKLVLWANQWSGLLGCPIFIVGSQLTDKINPNDVDIVIPMTKEQFEIEFGDINDWANESSGKYGEIKWKWWTRCNKIKEDGFNDTGLKLDVKIQPYSQFYGFMSHWKDLKPYRLDQNPDFDTEYFLSNFNNGNNLNVEDCKIIFKNSQDETDKLAFWKHLEKLPFEKVLLQKNVIDIFVNKNNKEFDTNWLKALINNCNVEQLIDLQKIIVDRLHIMTGTSKFKTIPAGNNFDDEDKLIELSKENEIKIPVFELVFDKNRNVIYVNDRDKTILRLQKSSKKSSIKSIFLSGKSENETFIDGHFDWLNINIKK